MTTKAPLTEEGTSRNIRGSELANIHYHDVGDGEPVIFLPSGPSSIPSTAWINYHKTLPLLAQHFRCILVDLVNYGLTGTFEYHEPGHHMHARMIIELMDRLGIEKAHIVGNSVGGTTALVLGINHADRVNKLVVGACNASSGGDPYLLAPRGDVMRIAGEFTANPTLEGMRKYMTATFNNEALVTDEIVDYMYQLYTTHPDHLDVRKRSRQTPHSNLPDLPCMKAPTLIIHGRYDRMVNVEVGLRLLNYIPDSRLVVLNHCGSWPPYEYPDEYSRQVLGFLQMG